QRDTFAEDGHSENPPIRLSFLLWTKTFRASCMVSFRVEPIPIYEDNYVWLLLIGAATWVVDPGNHLPVFEALRRHNRRLDGILVTHGHWDHVTGIAPLVDAFDGLPVVGSALCQHPAIDHPM